MRTRALCAVALAASGALTTVAGASSAGSCGSGNWSTVPLPSGYGSGQSLGGAGGQWIALPGSGDTLLASSGAATKRSGDGGCTWDDSQLGAQAGGMSYPPVVEQQNVYYVDSFGIGVSRGTTTLYAVYSSGFTVSASPIQVAVSHDLGRTWTLVQPAPSAAAAATPYCLFDDTRGLATAVAPSDPRVVYLVCTTSGAPPADPAHPTKAAGSGTYTLFRSGDGGASWSVVGTPTDFFDNTAFRYDTADQVAHALRVDPANPDMLWLCTVLVDADGRHDDLVVARSADAGATWQQSVAERRISTHTPSQTGVGAFGFDLTKLPGGAARVLAWSLAGGLVESTDAGKHWHVVRRPAKRTRQMVAGAAYVPNTTDILVAGLTGLPVDGGTAGPQPAASQLVLLRIHGPHRAATKLMTVAGVTDLWDLQVPGIRRAYAVALAGGSRTPVAIHGQF